MTPSPDFQLPTPDSLDFTKPLNITQALEHISRNGIDIFLLIGGTLAVFYIFYAGILYITSAGDPARVKTARSTLLHVIIGIVVMLSVFFIIRLAVGAGLSLSTTDTSG